MNYKINADSGSKSKLKLTIKIILMALIFLYPFISSFFGIDLGDSGLHLYYFENLRKTPELISFTSYFTSFVGYVWIRLFPGPTIWGLNLLEVILEMLMASAVYLTLRKYLGDIPTLAGILVAVMASDTYLNMFNYHQFNVFWLILVLCFEFLGITKEKLRYSFLAGLCLSAVVFSRMGSVTAVVTIVLYVIWFLLKDNQIKMMLKHIVALVIGGIIMTVFMVGLLLATGQLTYFINNIFRLEGLATASSGGYSMNNLMSTFINGNLNAIASGAIFLAAFIVLVMGLSILTQKCSTVRKQILAVIVALVAIAIAIYQLVFAYNVISVPAWPQMTTGPSFTIGIMYVMAFLVLAYHLFSKSRQDEFVMIVIMAFALPLLTIAGSNTGTKHVIMGMWIIAPVCAYLISQMLFNKSLYAAVYGAMQRIGMHLKKGTWVVAVLILCVFFFAKFGSMLYYTTNFDTIHRDEYTATINCDKTRLLRTTEREAESINSLLAEINNSGEPESRPLLVYGGSIMLYSLTNMPSYVQPWYTNGVYSNELLLDDLEAAEKKFDKLPVIVYCRTNNYYGYGENIYSKLVNSQMRSNYGGKKEILYDFMEEHGYNLYYANDYYCLIYPPDLSYDLGVSYKVYMEYGWNGDVDEDEAMYDEDGNLIEDEDGNLIEDEDGIYADEDDGIVDLRESEDAAKLESEEDAGYVNLEKGDLEEDDADEPEE